MVKINYEIAFKKPFSELKNLAIGTLLSIVPIVNLIAVGYFIGLVKETKKSKLPAFKNLFDLFLRGLLAAVTGLVYFIPALIVFTIAAGTAFTSILPILPALIGGAEPTSEIILQFTTTLLPIFIAVLPLFLLGIALSLLTSFVVPMAITRYVVTNKFSSVFEFKKIFRNAFTGDYFLAWLASVAVMLIVGGILSSIRFLGPAFASFVGGVFSYTLFGQIYKK